MSSFEILMLSLLIQKVSSKQLHVLLILLLLILIVFLANGLSILFVKGKPILSNVNNNLCGKLVSSLELPITFDERFKVTSVS